MARNMTACFRGKCASCGGAIYPGDTIRHVSRGRSFHLAGACEGDGGSGVDSYSAINPASGERMSNYARVSTFTTSSGYTGSRNVRGRCEDAPCCGCCTY